jgi:rhodanese-related sulfurtransferase
VAIDSTPPLEVTFITPEHLKARLDAGEYLCLIDARESAEFGLAHIPGAQWCARDLLSSHIERVAPTPYVPLVLYCSCGEAATLSVPILQRLGYTHIFVIQGGFLAWCAAGFPTETGSIDAPTSL